MGRRASGGRRGGANKRRQSRGTGVAVLSGVPCNSRQQHQQPAPSPRRADQGVPTQQCQQQRAVQPQRRRARQCQHAGAGVVVRQLVCGGEVGRWGRGSIWQNGLITASLTKCPAVPPEASQPLRVARRCLLHSLHPAPSTRTAPVSGRPASLAAASTASSAPTPLASRCEGLKYSTQSCATVQQRYSSSRRKGGGVGQE